MKKEKQIKNQKNKWIKDKQKIKNIKKPEIKKNK